MIIFWFIFLLHRHSSSLSFFFFFLFILAATTVCAVSFRLPSGFLCFYFPFDLHFFPVYFCSSSFCTDLVFYSCFLPSLCQQVFLFIQRFVCVLYIFTCILVFWVHTRTVFNVQKHYFSHNVYLNISVFTLCLTHSVLVPISLREMLCLD